MPSRSIWAQSWIYHFFYNIMHIWVGGLMNSDNIYFIDCKSLRPHRQKFMLHQGLAVKSSFSELVSIRALPPSQIFVVWPTIHLLGLPRASYSISVCYKHFQCHWVQKVMMPMKRAASKQKKLGSLLLDHQIRFMFLPKHKKIQQELCLFLHGGQ